MTSVSPYGVVVGVTSGRERSDSGEVTALFARRATLARSTRLLGEFRYEKSDPARFYGALAEDTAAMVGSMRSLT